MAKLEKPAAVADGSLEAIVDLCDGIMVARGDLGVEMNPEDVPIIQKKIVKCCRDRGTPVAGQHKRAKFPMSKAPISAIFHSFRLIFGRAIISRSGLEAETFLSRTRACAAHPR